MPRGSIFVKAAERIRPWTSGEKFTGISIVDSLGGIRQRQTGIQPVRPDLEPDPESSSWPAVTAVSNVPPSHPSGILWRANPLTGELGPYEADDAEIIYRLFGVTGPERNL